MTALNWLNWGPRQQATLFEVPRVIPTCHYCHQPKSHVQSLRAKLDTTDGVCCTPESDYRCPRCNSENLSFSDYDAPAETGTGYSDSGEVAHCNTCRWTGDPQDAAPAVQPWAELATVAQIAEEDEMERARRRAPIYREVA